MRPSDPAAVAVGVIVAVYCLFALVALIGSKW